MRDGESSIGLSIFQGFDLQNHQVLNFLYFISNYIFFVETFWPSYAFYLSSRTLIAVYVLFPRLSREKKKIKKNVFPGNPRNKTYILIKVLLNYE